MRLIGPAAARLEGVNNPQLLPTTPNVPVIDVAGFLSKGQVCAARAHLAARSSTRPDARASARLAGGAPDERGEVVGG